MDHIPGRKHKGKGIIENRVNRNGLPMSWLYLYILIFLWMIMLQAAQASDVETWQLN